MCVCVCCVFCVLTIASVVCASKQLNIRFKQCWNCKRLLSACVFVCCVFCVLTIASVACASKQLNKFNVIVIASTLECYPGNPLLTVLRVDDL